MCAWIANRQPVLMSQKSVVGQCAIKDKLLNETKVAAIGVPVIGLHVREAVRCLMSVWSFDVCPFLIIFLQFHLKVYE